MNNKIKYAILIILVALGGIGGYFAYGYYMNQQWENNFKLQTQALENGISHLNYTLELSNKLNHNKNEFDANHKEVLQGYNKSIEYLKQAMSYEQQMVNYSPDGQHKEYSKALLKRNQESLKLIELYVELNKLWTYSGFSDEARAKQISSEIETTRNNIEKLNNEKDQIKLLNPDLNKQVQKLSKEVEETLN